MSINTNPKIASIRRHIGRKKHVETRLRALNNMAFTVLSDKDNAIEEIITNGVAPLADVIGVDRITVYEQTEDENFYRLRRTCLWHRDDCPPGLETVEVPKNRSSALVSKTLRSGDPVNLDVSKAPEFLCEFFTAFGVKGICFVPIFIGENYRGVVMFGDFTRYRSFAKDDVETMRSVAHLCALAITRHEMYQSIKKHSEAAEQSSRYKTEFLAKMSHEIRTPMNAIIGMTELALRETNHETVLEHIATVNQAGSNLLSIINEILDFSKIEAGMMEISQREYSVASLLSDVISIIRTKFIGSQVSFMVTADSRIPGTLLGDEVRIRQAVLNILINAVKYTEKGYVMFSAYTSPGENEKEINLIFKVSDSGIGIKPENQAKLFTEFSQFDTDKNSNIEGVGLGLAITSSIVKAMNGQISVSSEYGKGSTFTLSIPQKVQSNDVFAEAPKAADTSVLIYDRNEMYANSIAYSVRNLGAQYNIADDDDMLRLLISGKKYDYLFISHAMYKKNKETVTQHGKNTKTVILADFGETIDEKNAVILTKPAYCTQIAAIFNGKPFDSSYSAQKRGTAGFTAPSAKVLIVDDIFTNLKVAEGLLKPYKVKTDLCHGGVAAVEAVQACVKNGEPYDLIFMDHKMPGVDGLEAVRRIRALGDIQNGTASCTADEVEYFWKVPIVALTANAVTTMIDVFINAGFNDYLFKPIDTTKLDTILRKWLPKNKRKKASA